MRCTEIVDILEVIRLSEMGLTQREVAASIKCGKTTVGEVRKRCQHADLTYATAKEMSSAEIKSLLYPAAGDRPSKAAPDWESVHKWLKGGKRRNLQFAWENYRIGDPAGLGYSQFCRQYKAWKDSTGKSVTMVLDHEPGKEMFIDWAICNSFHIAQSTCMAHPGLCVMRIVAFLSLAHLRYLSQNCVDM